MNQEQALEQYKDACYLYAAKYHRIPAIRRMYGVDDLFSIAQMSVLEAITAYREDRGTKLSTFVIQSIRWDLGRLTKPLVNRDKKHPTISIVVQDEDRGDFKHPEHYDIEPDSVALEQSLWGSMDEVIQTILRLRLVEGLHFTEIAKHTPYSNVHVIELYNQAMTVVQSRAQQHV